MKKFIFTTFYILFLIYPFSFCMTDSTLFMCSLLCIIFLIMPSQIIRKNINFNRIVNNNFVKWYTLIIFILSLLIRIITSFILSDNIMQISDFKTAYKTASTLDYSADYYRICIHWILLPKILNCIFNLFGSSQLVMFVFNSIICSISAVLIYYVSHILFKNKILSLFASILYIIWPANILYVGVCTPEHITQLLLLLAIFLSLLGFNESKKIKKYFLFLISGILLGLTTFFKNFGIVFVIALAIYFVLKLILNFKNVKKSILDYCICVLLILLGYVAITQLTFLYLDYLVGNTVSRSNIPYFLTVGLISTNNGTFSYDIVNNFFDDVKQSNYNYELVNSNMMKELMEDLKDNNNLSELLYEKAKIVIQNDQSRMHFLSQMALENGSTNFAKFLQNIIPLNNFYYLCIFSLVGIGLLKFLNQSYFNLELFFLYIAIFGCYLLLIIIEAQNRYNYSILPFLCILSTAGFYYLFKKIHIK